MSRYNGKERTTWTLTLVGGPLDQKRILLHKNPLPEIDFFIGRDDRPGELEHAFYSGRDGAYLRSETIPV